MPSGACNTIASWPVRDVTTLPVSAKCAPWTPLASHRGATSQVKAHHLVLELAHSHTDEDADAVWTRIHDLNVTLHTYLKRSEPRWWVAAYMTHTDDFEKTTSNGAEQENSRLKTLLIRSMMLLDMLDAVCKVVLEVWNEEEDIATSQIDKGTMQPPAWEPASHLCAYLHLHSCRS